MLDVEFSVRRLGHPAGDAHRRIIGGRDSIVGAITHELDLIERSVDATDINRSINRQDAAVGPTATASTEDPA